jgi:hypothetical protein
LLTPDPVFIKGHLTLKGGEAGSLLEFSNQSISVFGVGGLPWSTLNPQRDFGRWVETSVLIPGSDPFHFDSPAVILRESTLYHELMGLKFRLDPEVKERLSALIARHGTYPTEYIRKYPRIPSQESLRTFPLRVVLTAEHQTQVPVSSQDAPLSLDVENLSPNGVLLSTDNPIAQSIRPGSRVHLVLEPRGWFPVQVKAEGMICRVVDDIDSGNENVIRFLGVKFTRMDELDKAAFLGLLKDILENLKAKA